MDLGSDAATVTAAPPPPTTPSASSSASPPLSSSSSSLTTTTTTPPPPASGHDEGGDQLHTTDVGLKPESEVLKVKSDATQIKNGDKADPSVSKDDDDDEEDDSSVFNLNSEKMDVLSEVSLSPPILTKETDRNGGNAASSHDNVAADTEAARLPFSDDPDESDSNRNKSRPPSLDNYNEDSKETATGDGGGGDAEGKSKAEKKEEGKDDDDEEEAEEDAGEGKGKGKSALSVGDPLEGEAAEQSHSKGPPEEKDTKVAEDETSRPEETSMEVDDAKEVSGTKETDAASKGDVKMEVSELKTDEKVAKEASGEPADSKTESTENNNDKDKDKDVKDKTNEDFTSLKAKSEKSEKDEEATTTTTTTSTSAVVDIEGDEVSKEQKAEGEEKSEDPAKKTEEGRISPRRTRSQNKTKMIPASYLEDIDLDDEEEEDDYDLQITSVSGKLDIMKDKQLLKRSSSKLSRPDGSSARSQTSTDKFSSKSSPLSKTSQKCIVCHKIGKCKYNIVRNGDNKHLCDDECFRQFRVSPTVYLRSMSPVNASASSSISVASSMEQATPHYKICSVCQLMNINTNKHFLNWQGLDFCGEECLGKFQSSLGGTCSFCGSQVPPSAKAKYCLKLGTEIKQFCGTQCHAQFKKRLKVCCYCQKDLTNVSDSFMAPVGWEQGVFKDFCSPSCLQKYEEKNNKDVEIIGVEQSKKRLPCAVCGKVWLVKHEVKFEGKVHKMCSDPCLSAFQYANKLTMNTCDNCGVYCYNEGMQPQYIQFEGQQKRFCSFMCVNTFRALNKKVVSCAWCGSKKGNFDMIERVDANNKYQLFCSLNCLSLYRVNLQATSNQAVTCDHCRKFVPAQYHLTMSDASVRNFCSYNCVMAFQSQFSSPTSSTTVAPTPTKSQSISLSQSSQSKSSKPATRKDPLPPLNRLNDVQRSAKVSQKQGPSAVGHQLKQIPTHKTATQKLSNPYHSLRRLSEPASSPSSAGGQRPQTSTSLKSTTQVPVIISSQNTSQKTSLSVVSSGGGSSNSSSSSSSSSSAGTSTGDIGTLTAAAAAVAAPGNGNQQIIIQPTPPKQVKNKSLLCKPFVQTKATSCRPHTQCKEVQTEGEPEAKTHILPVPVPVYVPLPLPMYNTISPFMFPVPIPIPVPCFIPTTKKSASSIFKHIKEIQEKIPADPFEAELLMMAEAVAHSEQSTSDEEDGLDTAAADAAAIDGNDKVLNTNEDTLTVASITPQCEDTTTAANTCSKDFDDDVLQMSLNITAAEIPEPSLDLESFLEFAPPLGSSNTTSVLKGRLDMKSKQVGRGNKRPAVTPGRGGRRNKRSRVGDDDSFLLEGEENADSQHMSPDSNMSLKYTYGVYAWRQWVLQKNAQLEKVSKSGTGRLKLFKTNLLQCTPDELNYSLCLFVKEVRKPNKEEYSPDSILYLCLGIQQYLFENGRIDNIFTDMYYEKFTECLNEILIRYQPKINGIGQLVCRIEEEYLWECKQLGAHSPHVLLNTLIYFNTKHFMLKTPEDHIKLSFTHIMKHWKKTIPDSEIVNQKKRREEMPAYEQCENHDNPLRCPVKLYEFYLSKCPESIKNRNDVFYLIPERSCVPDSPVWYSTQSLSSDIMTKMLNRIHLVKEIQEACINTQPVYM
ncbi:zinc finger MYM-type protein 4 isoform X3 [Octopus sinensis]|uniref:Zinc finger MYM-type protein 4 isoform X3 n=1 Tax=Octopus sinensis TaxID=2607531 RepID=A0A7E6FSF6_9MOLL|nr:zinc finger MYM-type protein 4 isoform X3 [Octopus sinensis]